MHIATVIAYEAADKLFRANFSLLLGRAPDPDYVERVRASARPVPGVLNVTAVRAEYVGPGVGRRLTLTTLLHPRVRDGTLASATDLPASLT
jgi:divalent metal cation (Fe/Co/Zn/Cd) transporter